MAKIHIIGAGMAGLLAGCMLMNNHDVTIYEASNDLPSNHHALLRFRSNVVGLTLGIPFKEVEVCKVISNSKNPLSDSVRYSMKVNGQPSFRSITSANGSVEKRYIAPPDLIPRMAKILNSRILYNRKISCIDDGGNGEHLISTAPMNSNLLLASIKDRNIPEFKHRQGVVVSVDLDVDWEFYATVYFPDENTPFYRASITGKKLIIEAANSQMPSREEAVKWIDQSIHELGLISVGWAVQLESISIKLQPRAKIVPIDEQFRKRAIIDLSAKRIHSLGRFATWRPKLLLDDVVNDVRVIEGIINGVVDHTYRNLKG